MYARNEKVIPIYIEDEMKDSYISYAMSVIVGRALPDVRDGLKPVHRRILYTMKELGLEHNKPYKKSARIVGACLGQYHPHGDTAVYDSLVRMVQDFSLRYPLVDGQGNFGSVDGDNAAAMRYTEARMHAITETMLRDLEKNTVDFSLNFDESLKEPTVLPAVLPNLLVNGSSGIAVGMATNIPPHNLKEISDAIALLIEKPNTTVEELMKIVKGPDFPTGGIISGKEGIKKAYTTGRGIIKVSAKAYIETKKNQRESIVVTEIPYQVNKTNLIEQIAKLVQTKKVEGISDIRDESDKDGMRIVIDLKRNENTQVILNKLYKYTQMRGTFGIIMLALVNNSPRVLNLKEMLSLYIDHRKDVVIRRTKFELDKAERRAHILEGLKIALDNIDAVIKVIKSSKSTDIAKQNLIKKFGLSEIQAQAILEMQLQRLTGLERDKIEKEYLELLKKIEYLKSILASEKKVLNIVKTELKEVTDKFGDDRRTDITRELTDFEIEDLIAEESVVITISHAGYIKRIPISSYRKQRRGGKGVTGTQTREEDFVEHLYVASTHDYLGFFTENGRVYWLKVYEIPEGGRLSKGKAIVNILNLSKDEKIASTIPVKEFLEDKFIIIATSKGIVKKTQLSVFSNVRKGGVIAATVDKDDKIIGTALTDGNDEILLATKNGLAIRFAERQIRGMGRAARGVKGITLNKKDAVISMVVSNAESTVFTISAEGIGKRTKIAEYRVQSRGGKGIINMKTSKKATQVIGMKMVTDKDEIMIMTQEGMVVRCSVGDIRTTGRNTQGVKVISLKAKDKVTSIAKVVEEEENKEEQE